MKVLFVSPAPAVYGSERSMLAMLRSRTFDAEVVCPVGGDLERELNGLKIKVHPQEFGKYSLRENPFWHLGFFRHFRRILRVSNADVVGINLDGNTPLVTLSAALAGIPVVRFSRFEFVPPTRIIDRWCWRKASAVICPSESVRQQVLNWGGASFNRRTHRFYDAYVAASASADQESSISKWSDDDDELVIGCIGRMHRGKRFETAIESLALVRKRGKNARLVIIGGGDGSPQARAYLEELKLLGVKLGVSHAITFAGYLPHEQASGAYLLMDVFVLSSESESFGMVLMEAWAHGIPTVSSDVGGCSEITRASGGGYLAPIGDANSFCEHILHLLDAPDVAAAMGRKGKDWVATNCNPDAYAERFRALLNEISHGA